MVGRGPSGQAIGIARWDVEGIQDAQTVLQIADAGRQLSGDGRRQIAAGAPEAVAPRLLAMAQERFMAPLWRRWLVRSLVPQTGPIQSP